MDGAGHYCGTEGQVERLYWREETLWIRIRTQQGRWLSIPWHDTDLPSMSTVTFPECPHLSPQALLKLVQHLNHQSQRHSKSTGKQG